MYTDTVSFEKATSITSDGVTTSYNTDADIVTNTDRFGRVTSKALSIDTAKDGVTYSIDSSHILSYADTDTTATTKVTSLTSTVTNGTNTVGCQEYYEYDAVGNITGIYRYEGACCNADIYEADFYLNIDEAAFYGFNYLSGIADCYYKTDCDPYYNETMNKRSINYYNENWLTMKLVPKN